MTNKLSKARKIIIIAGPTASGKSALAMNLAKHTPISIINADSKQLYKEIPIITAQPSLKDKELAQHMIYGEIPSSENCSVGKWLEIAKEKINLSWQNNKLPVLVGGTGMYLKSIEHGISAIPDISDEIRDSTRKLFEKIGCEEFYKKIICIDSSITDKIKPNDSHRLMRAYEVHAQTGKSITWWQKQPLNKIFDNVNYVGFFLNPPRQEIYNNSDKRFLTMLKAGAIDEVKNLTKLNLDKNLPAMKSLGVPEIIAYLGNKITLTEATINTQKHSRHYIKRQITWFKNQMPNYYSLDKPDIKFIISKI